MESRKIIILDDHTLFLKGMTLIIKECCADCDVYAYQSIKKLKDDKLKFDDFSLLISDIELPNEDTFGLFNSLKNDYPDLPILVVSMHKKQAIIKKCKVLGIEGYILKNEDEQLNSAIQTIINGKQFYSKTINDYCKENKTTNEKLSVREEEILKLFTQGYSNLDIAEKLFVSIDTIKTHKKNIRIKLDVNSSHEMIEYAKENFLL